MKKVLTLVFSIFIFCNESFAEEIILKCQDEDLGFKSLVLYAFEKKGNRWTFTYDGKHVYTEGIKDKDGSTIKIDINKTLINYIIESSTNREQTEINRYTGEYYIQHKNKTLGKEWSEFGNCENAKKKF